jgi:hypothetical protein
MQSPCKTRTPFVCTTFVLCYDPSLADAVFSFLFHEQVGFMCASDMCRGGAGPPGSAPPTPHVLLRQPGAFVEVCTNEEAAAAAGWEGVVTIGGGAVKTSVPIANVRSGKLPRPCCCSPPPKQAHHMVCCTSITAAVARGILRVDDMTRAK